MCDMLPDNNLCIDGCMTTLSISKKNLLDKFIHSYIAYVSIPAPLTAAKDLVQAFMWQHFQTAGNKTSDIHVHVTTQILMLMDDI